MVAPTQLYRYTLRESLQILKNLKGYCHLQGVIGAQMLKS